MINDHRKLWIYQESYDLATIVEKIAADYPRVELFRLTDQTLRCSRAPAALIAELWRKRHYPLLFKNKLVEAEGEASEAQHWLRYARDLGFAPPVLIEELEGRYDGLMAGLLNTRLNWSKWCFRPRKDE